MYFSSISFYLKKLKFIVEFREISNCINVKKIIYNPNIVVFGIIYLIYTVLNSYSIFKFVLLGFFHVIKCSSVSDTSSLFHLMNLS